MTHTIPYVRNLRTTAATIAAQHITAGWRSSSSEAGPCAVIEAALDAAAPFLVDAYLIEEAMAAADKQAEGNPYEYLGALQCDGSLKLRTFDVDEGDAADAAMEPK